MTPVTTHGQVAPGSFLYLPPRVPWAAPAHPPSPPDARRVSWARNCPHVCLSRLGRRQMCGQTSRGHCAYVAASRLGPVMSRCGKLAERDTGLCTVAASHKPDYFQIKRLKTMQGAVLARPQRWAGGLGFLKSQAPRWPTWASPWSRLKRLPPVALPRRRGRPRCPRTGSQPRRAETRPDHASCPQACPSRACACASPCCSP